MKKLLICFFVCSNAYAGPYVQGAIFYNQDAYGVTSNSVIQGAFGYKFDLNENLDIELQARIEEDPKNKNEDDYIAFRAYGFLIRAKTDGFYIGGGLFYNPDAWGVTSNTLAHVSAGYEYIISEYWEINAQLKHESDPMNNGAKDYISNESAGAILRLNI